MRHGAILYPIVGPMSSVRAIRIPVHQAFSRAAAFAIVMRSRLSLLPPLIAAVASAGAANAQDNASAPVVTPIPSLSRPSLPRSSGQTLPDQQRRQGPELDVFRDSDAPAPSPPILAPPLVTTTPPATVPTPASMPRPDAKPPAPNQRADPHAQEPQAEPTGRAMTQREETAPAQSDDMAPRIANEAPAPVGDDGAAGNTISAPAQSPPTATSATPWGWIAAALAVVIVAALAFLLRRRPEMEEREDVEDAAPPPARPVDPRQPRPKSARPASATLTPPTAPATRPWIEIDLAIDSVRLAVAGLSVAYRIALRNRGDDVARGVIAHALLGHADANQNELLRAFFAGQSGQPVHMAAEIAAGESLVLTGELILPAQAIEPVELDGRLLLVPLIAFDVQYRWDAGSAPGGGRTGSAFIVGREQAPPSPRLAPFRWDLGPRDHRGAGIGCRRTALSLAS